MKKGIYICTCLAFAVLALSVGWWYVRRSPEYKAAAQWVLENPQVRVIERTGVFSTTGTTEFFDTVRPTTFNALIPQDTPLFVWTQLTSKSYVLSASIPSKATAAPNEADSSVSLRTTVTCRAPQLPDNVVGVLSAINVTDTSIVSVYTPRVELLYRLQYGVMGVFVLACFVILVYHPR